MFVIISLGWAVLLTFRFDIFASALMAIVMFNALAARQYS
jgi:hypothetical protein